MFVGKVKLAGARLNCAVMDWLNQPVADVRGLDPLMAKLGTRGMTKARVTPMLRKVEAGVRYTHRAQKWEEKHIHRADCENDEYDRAPGEPFATE